MFDDLEKIKDDYDKMVDNLGPGHWLKHYYERPDIKKSLTVRKVNTSSEKGFPQLVDSHKLRYCKPTELHLCCPGCNDDEYLYRDKWHHSCSCSGASGTSGSSGDDTQLQLKLHERNFDEKYICIACWIEFIVKTNISGILKRDNYKENYNYMEETTKQKITSYSRMQMRNGFYMIDSDIWQEKYYDEHGRYYLQIWG